MLRYQDFKYIDESINCFQINRQEKYKREEKALSYPSAINFLRYMRHMIWASFSLKFRVNAHNYITSTEFKELPNRTSSQRYEAIPKAI